MSCSSSSSSGRTVDLIVNQTAKTLSMTLVASHQPRPTSRHAVNITVVGAEPDASHFRFGRQQLLGRGAFDAVDNDVKTSARARISTSIWSVGGTSGDGRRTQLCHRGNVAGCVGNVGAGTDNIRLQFSAATHRLEAGELLVTLTLAEMESKTNSEMKVCERQKTKQKNQCLF